VSELHALAAAHGVETTWVDVHDEEHTVDDDVLRAVLALLGAAVHSEAEAADALRARHQAAWRRTVEPVTVAWDGRGVLDVRAPVAAPPDGVDLVGEDGAEDHLPVSGEPLEVEEVEGVAYGRWEVALAHLPAGVHHVRVGDAAGAVLAAPHAIPPRGGRRRQWGVFAPLYALRDERDGPVGDLTTLRAFADWAADRGADWVATLPLLPGRYDGDPVDPSPYRPLTRTAWNELHLDLGRLPELDGVERPVLSVDPHQVDWAAVDRDVHALLARAVDRLSDRRRAELEVFLAARPHLAEYARWRGGGQGAVELLHAYAQWALDEQLADLTRTLDERGQALYLDLALGVDPDGFDVVAQPEAFATGASVGAPPDEFFTGGQDWGFPPPHPEGARTGGHPYLRACLDHHLPVARMLRLDHVMGLHRLWWIPEGAPAGEGAYVHYAADEQYAVLALAAARHGAEVVGENLGTVPPEVNAAMEDHGLVGMWPYQLAVPAGDTEPPRGWLATLNTHDMAPYATWRRDHPDAPPVGDALAELGASHARHVQVGLEDLWGETEPQNVPGTGPEAGNWRRRAARTLPEVAADAEVAATLDGLEAARRTEETLTERSAS
jgi:4-alpha-glucanotransferase